MLTLPKLETLEAVNLNMVLSSSEPESSGLLPLLDGGGLTLLTLDTERPKLGLDGFLDEGFLGLLVRLDRREI